MKEVFLFVCFFVFVLVGFLKWVDVPIVFPLSLRRNALEAH